jgi:hypothetical protein
MKIKFTDVHGEILPNIEITFVVNNVPVELVSDGEGIVEFFDAWDGDEVTCYIHEEEKHKFTFKEGDIPEVSLAAPLVDMIFVTTNENDESVIGATIYFEYLNEQIKAVSDNTGQIVLEKIPVNTEVKVYQLHNGEEYNVEINKCKKDKAQYFISVDKDFDFSYMKFKLVDKSGQVIRGADVRFKVEDNEFESVTDQEGCIVINDVKVGSLVECKQMIFGKSLPWHKFKCESGVDEYILHGEKPQAFSHGAEKYDSQVRMKFRLVNSKNQPIPNAVVRLEYGDKVRNKYTNQNGEAMVDDVLIGDKVNVFVDVRGTSVSSEFICQEDDEMHQIILKTSNPKLLFWLIPIVVIVILGIFFANSDFSGSDSSDADDEVVEKKDTLIINNYYFQVVENGSDEPIQYSKVKLIYNDTAFEKVTDKDGIARFKSLENKLPHSYEVAKLGLRSQKNDYKLDSVFTVKLTKDDSVSINTEKVLCNTLIESDKIKTNYQSFKMNIPKGYFKIWMNFFGLDQKLDIYRGGISEVSEKNRIYTTEKFKKGIWSPNVEFESKDSTITVCVTSSTDKASWVYKVYCARLSVSKPVTPVQ